MTPHDQQRIAEIEAPIVAAWQVATPKGHEFDYIVCPDRDEAENYAADFSAGLEEGDPSEFKAEPLYANDVPKLIQALAAAEAREREATTLLERTAELLKNYPNSALGNAIDTWLGLAPEGGRGE